MSRRMFMCEQAHGEEEEERERERECMRERAREGGVEERAK